MSAARRVWIPVAAGVAVAAAVFAVVLVISSLQKNVGRRLIRTDV